MCKQDASGECAPSAKGCRGPEGCSWSQIPIESNSICSLVSLAKQLSIVVRADGKVQDAEVNGR
jgi:hypothetical protein